MDKSCPDLCPHTLLTSVIHDYRILNFLILKLARFIRPTGITFKIKEVECRGRDIQLLKSYPPLV